MPELLAFAHYVMIAARLKPLPKRWGSARSGYKKHAPLSPTCNRGHEFAGDNLRIAPDGKRKCRACARMRYEAKRDGR